MSSVYGIGGFVNVPPAPLSGNGAPPSTLKGKLGQQFFDRSVSPPVEYIYNGQTWQAGGNAYATTSSPGIVELATNVNTDASANPTFVADVSLMKTYVDGIAIAGAPVATTTTAGIGELATDAEAIAGTASTGLLALFVTPSNLAPVLASPSAIGGTVAAAGTFTALTADGTGAVSLGSSTAGDFTVATGDLSLISTLGSLVLTAGESATDAVKIESSIGGIQILASGAAAGEDIVLTATGSSVRLTSTESATDSINIESTAGGVKILASGASAGEDIVLTATGSSIRLTATESATDSINIESTAGGVNILASGASAGEDINITATGSSVNVNSTENAALAIYLHADGGASETIRLRADQGTGAASIDLASDVGGVTITGGLGTADAINIVASDAAGGIDIDSGTGGFIADSTGVFTLTSTANSANAFYLHANGGTSETLKVHADQGTGVASVQLLSDVGGVTIQGGLSTADAINIVASGVAGGIDIDSGTNGFIVDSTGPCSIDVSGASNFTVATGDLSLIATLSSVNITANEDAADAVVITSAAGGIDILATGAAGQDIDIVNTGGSVNISATENNSGAMTLSTNGGTSEQITVTCSQGTNAASIGLISTAGGITLTGGLATADAININTSAAGGGIDIDAGTQGFIVDTTGAVSLDSATASNFTVTGAADLTLQSTAGAVNVISGEANADSINVTSAGGMNIVATGAAAKDTIITNTNGSVTITAGESVTDAFNLTASGAASRMTLTAGTGSISLQSGLVVKKKDVVFADSPYTVLGTDYFLSVDTSGGAITITLPNAATLAGRTYVIRDTGGAAAASNITIGTGGGNLVGGGASAATKVISAAYAGATVWSNGTTWNYAYVA